MNMTEKENTPVKSVGLGLLGKPKNVRFCVVCGRDILVFRKYCTLAKDGVGDKLSIILKRKCEDVRNVSNYICYNCKLKVEQVSSLKEIEEGIKTAFNAREALVALATHERVKRMSKSPGEPRKRATARTKLQEERFTSQVRNYSHSVA